MVHGKRIEYRDTIVVLDNECIDYNLEAMRRKLRYEITKTHQRSQVVEKDD